MAVIYFRKMINIFHKDYLKKPTAILPSIKSAPLMAKSTAKLTVKLPTEAKRKQSQLAKSLAK